MSSKKYSALKKSIRGLASVFDIDVVLTASQTPEIQMKNKVDSSSTFLWCFDIQGDPTSLGQVNKFVFALRLFQKAAILSNNYSLGWAQFFKSWTLLRIQKLGGTPCSA